jgi:hypothetical protein
MSIVEVVVVVVVVSIVVVVVAVVSANPVALARCWVVQTTPSPTS